MLSALKRALQQAFRSVTAAEPAPELLHAVLAPSPEIAALSDAELRAAALALRGVPPFGEDDRSERYKR